MLESKIQLPSRATEACCTCASLLPTAPTVDDATEKPTPAPQPRRLPCCLRVICAPCLATNPRFALYCPFCQISTAPSALPQGLRDPPSYDAAAASAEPRDGDGDESRSEPGLPGVGDEPPPYTAEPQQPQHGTAAETGAQPRPGQDLTHHLQHPDDSIASLALLYGVPRAVLRAHNGLAADDLLFARHSVRIPASHYAGPSLSPAPVRAPAEEARRRALRRFMVACKVAEYEVAEVYLEQEGWGLERAVERYREDERWEREHPLHPGGKGKGKIGRRLMGQR